MLDLAFTVYDEPSAMPRPRAAVIGGKPRMYMPSAMRAQQYRIRAEAIAVYGLQTPEYEGPVALQVDAFFAPRKSMPKRDVGKAQKTSTPDAVNIAAQVCDALNHAVWRDDSQVVLCRVQKHYAWNGERPRVEVKVRSVD